MTAEAAIEPSGLLELPSSSELAAGPSSVSTSEKTKPANLPANLDIICETPLGTDEPRSPIDTDTHFAVSTAMSKLRQCAVGVPDGLSLVNSRMELDAMSDLSSVPPSENEAEEEEEDEEDAGRLEVSEKEDDNDDSELSSELSGSEDDDDEASSTDGSEDEESDLSELSSSDGEEEEEQDANGTPSKEGAEEGRGKRHAARTARAKIGADAARPISPRKTSTAAAPGSSVKRSHKAKHGSKGKSHARKSGASELSQSYFDGTPRRATRNTVAVVEAAEAAAKVESAAAAEKAARRARKQAASSASASQHQQQSAGEESPALPLTERQKAKIEADKLAAAAEASKKREMKKLEAEKKKEQKRKERLAWQEYRRQQIEEEQALLLAQQQQQGEEAGDEAEQQSVSPPKKRSHKKAKLTVADEEGDDMDASAAGIRAPGRRGKKSKFMVHKKAPVEPLQIPDYLALSPELRSKPCLQDVRPAYFYPDLPSCSLEEWDEDGIPVFQPTMEQFEDFYAFMTAVDAWGMRSGIVKIIPPKEWLDALPSIRKADVEAAGFDPRAALESVRIKSAIEQNFTLAGSGVWRQANVVRPNKVWNVKTWADESAAPKRKGPELKRMQRKCLLDDEAKEAARKGVEVVGSKTRSGRLVDAHASGSRAATHHDKQQRKRKRESNAAMSTGEAPRDSNTHTEQPQTSLAAEQQQEQHATQAEAVAMQSDQHDEEMPALEPVHEASLSTAASAPSASDSAHSPVSSMFDQQHAPNSPLTSATTVNAQSPGADSSPEKSQRQQMDFEVAEAMQDDPQPAGRSMAGFRPQGIQASAESAPVAPKAVPVRKRSPSVSGLLQPSSVSHLLSNEPFARKRSASMSAEESSMLKILRSNALTDAEIPKRSRKRPDWHSKKRTEADKTTSRDWSSFDPVNCWLQEAASFEEPIVEDEHEDDQRSVSASSEGKLIIPTPNDWTSDICSQIEGEYWRGLNNGIAPMYGADQEGTLFTPRTKNWNVGSLDNILTRMKLSTQLPGVTTPYLYLGMWRATFAWHVEDMDLYSINYIHFGAPKQWYAIRQADRIRFENIMKAAFPQDSGRCAQFMRHKSYLASPTYLRERGVDVLRLVHHAQEFVVTYPFGYHSGYNLGFNCAESVNFALEPWMEIGRNAQACGCVDFSVRMDVEALLHESNTLKAAEDNAKDVLVEQGDEDMEQAGDGQGDEMAPDTAPQEASEAAKARDAMREKRYWLKEGQRLEAERESLKKGPARYESLDDFAKRAIELRKAQEHFDKWQKEHAAEISARRSEAQVLRKVREQERKERELAEEAEKASKRCPCVFCLSKLELDLVEIADQDEAVPKKMAHRSCVSLVPETYLIAKAGEDVHQEGKDVVLGFEKIPKGRWGLRCGTCKVPYGVPIQCTYGKCVTAAHISCMIPDDPTQEDPDREQWLVKHLPRSEANILNGKVKKPTKKSKAVAAKQALTSQPTMSSNSQTPALTELPTVTHTTASQVPLLPPSESQPSAQLANPLSTGPSDAASAPDVVATTPSFIPGADPQPVVGQAHQPSGAPLADSVLAASALALPALTAQPEPEEDEIVVLCPTHNPDWKAIISARRAAKKLQDLRKRVLELQPGTLVKFRHKGGAVWQSLLLEIQDSEDSEGKIVVRDDAVGTSAMPWSRIIFAEVEAAMIAKRKISETPERSSASTPDAEPTNKRIRLVGAHVSGTSQPTSHEEQILAAIGEAMTFEASHGMPDQRMQPLTHYMPGVAQFDQNLKGPTHTISSDLHWQQSVQQAANGMHTSQFGPAGPSQQISQEGHYSLTAASAPSPFPQGTPPPIAASEDQPQTLASSNPFGPAQQLNSSMSTHLNN